MGSALSWKALCTGVILYGRPQALEEVQEPLQEGHPAVILLAQSPVGSERLRL